MNLIPGHLGDEMVRRVYFKIRLEAFDGESEYIKVLINNKVKYINKLIKSGNKSNGIDVHTITVSTNIRNLQLNNSLAVIKQTQSLTRLNVYSVVMSIHDVKKQTRNSDDDSDDYIAPQEYEEQKIEKPFSVIDSVRIINGRPDDSF